MSSKQDRAGVRTAQDLEQKYNLSSIVTIKKAVENTAKGLVSTNNELNNFIEVTTKNLEEIQNQVDGNLTTWFYSGVPTTTNPPASEWTTYEEKAKHVGDLYYDKDTGYAYRWFQEGDEFSWTKMSDSDVTEALAIANAALDTADSKRRVFVVQPTTPYDVGDIWFRNNEDLYRCATARESGAFDASDFVVATKYTDDTVANEAKAIAEDLKTTVETHYVTNTKLKTTTDSINTSVEKLALQVDEKNKVFTTKPTPPYYVGDVYVLNDKIYYCTTERKTGEYTESDWELSVDAGTLVSKTEFNQTAEDIRGSVEALDNDYQTTKTTRKTASGNPTYISDSGGYALEKDFIYGMSIQETSTASANKLDLSRVKNGWIDMQNGAIGTNADYPNACYSDKIYLKQGEKIYVIGNTTELRLRIFKVDNSYYGSVQANNYTAPMDCYIRILWLDTLVGTPIVKINDNSTTQVDFIPNMPSPDYPSEIINNKGIENLLNKNVWERGYLDASGNKATNNNVTLFENIEINPSTEYTISLNNTSLAYRYVLYDKDKKFISRSNELYGIRTLTTPSNAKYLRMFINVQEYATQEIIDSLYIQIEKGSIAHPCVPYGSNYLIQKICGKNIFDGNITKYLINNDGSIYSNANWNLSDYIEVEQNKKYTFSHNDTTLNQSLIISEYDDNKTFIKRNVQGQLTENTPYKITTSANTKYVRLNYNNTFGNEKFQFEKDEVTEYEPYKETLITYDLQGNELCRTSKTKDNTDLISGLFAKKIVKIVLNGSETNIQKGTYGTNAYYIPVSNAILSENTANVLSSHFIGVSYNERTAELDNIVYLEHNTNIYIRNTKFTTLQEFKAFLKEQYDNGTPVTFQYINSKAETIQLEPTEIKLYEGINNIYTESNIDVEEVDITYLTDSVLNTQYATKSEVKIAEENITSSINSRIDDTALNLKQELNTSFQLTANNITSEVASTYATNDDLGSLRNEMSTRWTQTNNTFEMQFKTLNSEVSNIDQLVNTNQATLEKYVRFIDGALELGNNESPISLKIENDMLAFYQNDTKIAYISNNKLYITDGFFTNSLRIDSFGFFKEDNGSLSFGKVG